MQTHNQTCLTLWDRGTLRKAYLAQRISLENRMRGLVRAQLGFSTRVKLEDMTKTQKKEAEAFKKQAKEIVDGLLKGKDDSMNRQLSFAGFLAAHATLAESITNIEAQMVEYVRTLPYYNWAMEQPGIGEVSLATLIAEIVDLTEYSNPAKVWKRMGVGVIKGERQRKVAGNPELALEHGYNCQRRSVVWNIAKRIIMQKNRKTDHPLIQYYVREKERQLAKGLTAGHAENRARIHTGKKFLKHLWRQANPTIQAKSV